MMMMMNEIMMMIDKYSLHLFFYNDYDDLSINSVNDWLFSVANIFYTTLQFSYSFNKIFRSKYSLQTIGWDEAMMMIIIIW